MIRGQIEDLWGGYNFNSCEDCENKNCNGRLNYANLCSNLNYLKEYGQKNYEKNTETFAELQEILQTEKPMIFSFGAGIGLDYIGAKEVFGENVGYFLIDEHEWAITKTENYKTFTPKLPGRPLNFKEGMAFLRTAHKNAVVCFFNSLFTISENTDLQNELLKALAGKESFYFVCNYTINGNFHLPSTEMEFINKLTNKLRGEFHIKKHEILDGKGIIIKGEKNDFKRKQAYGHTVVSQ